MISSESVETSGIYGRDAELENLRSFLAMGSPGAFLLQGEAGIGKTTLWEAGIAVARRADRRVISCRPTAAEAQLSFGALGDLLEGSLEDVLPVLPAPQRRALEIALLLEDPGDDRPDRRAIAVAFVNGLRSLAAAAPLLLAVDDVQWLDRPSAGVIAFAVRRLRNDPVALLLAERVTGRSPAPLGLDGSLLEVRRVRLGPLSLGALHEFLRSRLGTSFPRPVLRRIDGLAGGNPFFALELARSLRDGESVETMLPADLGVLVRSRLETLPEPTRAALLAVALLGEPTLALVEQVVSRRDLEPGISAGVVETDGELVRFSHPLLAVAARESAGPIAEQDLHRRLAVLAPTSEERVRHLAAGTSGQDEDVAAALHEAAHHARQRGAPAAAAELAEEALRLAPVGGDLVLRGRRALDAAVAHFEAGDSARAQALLESLIAELPASLQRAEVLWRLGAILRERNDRAAPARLEQGLREAGDSPALRAVLHKELAWVAIVDGTIDDACMHAAAALELAERLGDDELLAEVVGTTIYTEFAAGRAVEQSLVERALALERESKSIYLDSAPSAVLGYRLMLDFRLDEARGYYESLRERAAARGDEPGEFGPVFFLAFIELFAGHWELADGLATEAIALAEQTGAFLREALYVRCAVDGHLGRVEATERTAARGLELAERDGATVYPTRFLGVLGFLELSRGHAAEAATYLHRAGLLAEESGLREPAMARFRPDEAEALVATGELDAAALVLDWFEARAREVGRRWVPLVAARARGLLAAARGDLDDAIALLEFSREGLADLPVPLEQARTLLVLGSLRRRARQKRTARETLEQALAIFEKLGAPLWAAQARGELQRIGGRPAASGELTPTERRIAGLVAEGRSNKEVAAVLTISNRTVENHLARIYDKLGVRSRTALAGRIAQDAAQG